MRLIDGLVVVSGLAAIYGILYFTAGFSHTVDNIDSLTKAVQAIERHLVEGCIETAK